MSRPVSLAAVKAMVRCFLGGALWLGAATESNAGALVFVDDSSTRPELFAIASLGGATGVREYDKVPSTVSQQASDARGSAFAQAGVQRTFGASAMDGALTLLNTQFNGSAHSEAIDEFKIVVDEPTSIRISASVTRLRGGPGDGYRFYLQGPGGGFPLVLHSDAPFTSNPPPSTEPRYTVTLQPGTYLFHAEAQHSASASFSSYQNGQSGFTYRIETVPEPGSLALLASAMVVLTVRRSRPSGRFQNADPAQ